MTEPQSVERPAANSLAPWSLLLSLVAAALTFSISGLGLGLLCSFGAMLFGAVAVLNSRLWFQGEEGGRKAISWAAFVLGGLSFIAGLALYFLFSWAAQAPAAVPCQQPMGTYERIGCMIAAARG